MRQTDAVPALALTLGTLLTLTGALTLVQAARHQRAGRPDAERRLFRWAVLALALGSALLLVTVVVTNPV